MASIFEHSHRTTNDYLSGDINFCDNLKKNSKNNIN